jgi:predicted RNase H-like nuclease (RuvC/YqgF family)
MHDRNTYINAIEKDGVEEDIAFDRSLVNIYRGDIKDISKSSNGSAVIMMKSKSTSLITTVEKYDDIIETIQKADIAVNIMYQEKIFIFDDFEVNDDELNVSEGWSAIKDDM